MRRVPGQVNGVDKAGLEIIRTLRKVGRQTRRKRKRYQKLEVEPRSAQTILSVTGNTWMQSEPENIEVGERIEGLEGLEKRLRRRLNEIIKDMKKIWENLTKCGAALNALAREHGVA